MHTGNENYKKVFEKRYKKVIEKKIVYTCLEKVDRFRVNDTRTYLFALT
jgi:hypothetical protein